MLCAIGGITVHSKSLSHKQAMISWNAYTHNADRHNSIADRLDYLCEQEIKKNQHYIKFLLPCSKQELALQTHGESSKFS